MNNLDIIISTSTEAIIPRVLEGVIYKSERYSTPGELKFKILKGENTKKINEGDRIAFSYQGYPIFFGFIFTISRTKDEVITITAFDQLRYLKNKDTYIYTNKRADELVKLIAEDFRLNLGELDNTQFVIPKRIEDNKTLLDIINTALDLTTQNIKKIYVLFDDVGNISLKDIETLGIELLIDETVTEDYSYMSTIDNKTYNQIKLIKNNDKTGKREVWFTKSTENQNKWGILQLFDTVNYGEDGIKKADSLLKLHNQVFKSLSLKNVQGDVRCKGGFSLVVNLNLQDIIIKNKMIINRVTHTFNYQEHLMSLDLIGGVINV